MRKTLLLTILSVFILMLLSCGNPTTTEETTLETGTVTDVEGNVYQTVKIGNQWWMAENLRTTKYNDGSAIPHFADSASWINDTLGAYCYYNDSTEENFIKKYGALYNWYAIDTKKLAPTGCHVPTDAEWTTLEKYLVLNGYTWDGTTDTSFWNNKIAQSLAAKTDWYTSKGPGAPGNDLTTNNRSGFSALPGGSRQIFIGDFWNIGINGYWWSATEYDSSMVWNRCLNTDRDYLILSYYGTKTHGFSVRLVKD